MHPRMIALGTFALAAGFASRSFAQAPPPPPPGPRAPAYTASTTSIVSGRVKQFVPNPNGEIDGLLLADGTQVNFPPHLTLALLQAVRIGDVVSVQGVRGPAGGTIHASVITNSITKRSMVDQPPSPDRPPPAPPALTAITAQGRVVQLLHADMGELNGAILEDGTVVRWPPPFGAQIHALLQEHTPLQASGYGSQSAYGKALEATSVAVNGQAPVPIYGPPPGSPPARPGFRPSAP